MSINSRSKGKRGEREAVELLRQHGIPARRGVQYSGGPGTPDVTHALSPIVHFEVKLVSKLELEDWYDQAFNDGVYRVPVVLHRLSSRKVSTPWRATLSAAHLAMLYGREDHMAVTHGDPTYVAEYAADLPVASRVVQSDALRFEKELAAILASAAPGRPAALFHARREHDALWMASMEASSFLEHALLPYAVREYGYHPTFDTSEYTPEMEREYDRFWQAHRVKLAENFPLFKAAD